MRVQGRENKERICVSSKSEVNILGMPISYRLVMVWLHVSELGSEYEGKACEHGHNTIYYL